MGNRSRYMMAGSAAAGVVGFRALAKAHGARGREPTEAGSGAVVPSQGHDAGEPASPADVAHAPGHRHLKVPADVWREPQPPPVYAPPFPKRWYSLFRRGG